jgi:hypothetical protein
LIPFQSTNKMFRNIRILAVIILLIVFAAVIYALSASNAPPFLETLSQPAMIATIIDVYGGIAWISAWMVYREGNIGEWRTLTWIAVFIVTGNIGTAIYVLKASFDCDGDPSTFFLGKRTIKTFMHSTVQNSSPSAVAVSPRARVSADSI